MLGGNSSITTYREETDVDGHINLSSTATLSNVPCYIEKLNAQDAALEDVDGQVKLFNLITDEIVDLQIGDQIIEDNTSDKYTVHSLQVFKDNIDVPNHVEAVITGGWSRSR